jgi:N6-adenosine-specific RNA methylase IME4
MYQVIIADPPWSFQDKLTMSDVQRGAASQYPVMDNAGLLSLAPQIQSVADQDGCVLALWVVGSQLELGLQLMRAWGFVPKQTAVWVKTKKAWDPRLSVVQNLAFGMGRLFRQSHELCLIGTRGRPYQQLRNRSQRSVFAAPNLGHSRKPDKLHESLETMFPDARRLELFARRTRPGWDCLGNEIDGLDIRKLPDSDR